MITFSFEAIGTHWQIDITAVLSSQKQDLLLQKIKTRIETFDKTYSRFRSDSLITAISEKKSTYQFPPDASRLFSLYERVYKLSTGTFTPLIGKTLAEAGYDKKYSFQPKTLHQPPTWQKAMKYDANTQQLITHQPLFLDFGAAGKGYIIDIIGELLTNEQIATFCIDAGGDILYKTSSDKPLRVGLEHPEHTDEVIGVATIKNKSICGSSGNRRKWGNFHHIINPKTLSSPTDILSTWVISEETIIADALATCLFLTDVEKLTKHFDFEYLIMYPNHTIKKSLHFPGELFYT